MTFELTASDVARLRLNCLLLNDHASKSVEKITQWFGAMQAQDLASGKWSFGVRLPGATEQDIDRAIEKGRILRTWPLRGTLHFVPAEDAHWLLALTGKLALKGAAKRREFLGLTEKTAHRAATLLGEALAGGRRMTREEIRELWTAKGLKVEGQCTYHLLWYASQMGVSCMGPYRNNEQAFVLLDEWVKKPKRLTEEESLQTLALRYFQSHGPVSREDFAGWTGLPVATVKRAITMLDKTLTQVTCQSKTLYVIRSQWEQWQTMTKPRKPTYHVLPGFDEYLLGIKDRASVLSPEHKSKIIPGNNGIFMPTLVVNGQVLGTWKRTIKTKTVVIDAHPFVSLKPAQTTSLASRFKEYAAYLGLEPLIQIH
jgi:hypothetical protein